jgi:hypothetical protein
MKTQNGGKQLQLEKVVVLESKGDPRRDVGNGGVGLTAKVNKAN